ILEEFCSSVVANGEIWAEDIATLKKDAQTIGTVGQRMNSGANVAGSRIRQHRTEQPLEKTAVNKTMNLSVMKARQPENGAIGELLRHSRTALAFHPEQSDDYCQDPKHQKQSLSHLFN